jgi:hypothetical protein
MPPTTLPAPEIEIGSRLPVVKFSPGFAQESVSQFTKAGEKI